MHDRTTETALNRTAETLGRAYERFAELVNRDSTQDEIRALLVTDLGPALTEFVGAVAFTHEPLIEAAKGAAIELSRLAPTPALASLFKAIAAAEGK